MLALPPVKDGGVSGAWDRLRYIRLCLYTTLTTMSFVREGVIQYFVRKWIRVMRQRCIVSRSLSDAFHERKRSRALSTIKLLILSYRSFYCTVFGKVSGELRKFRAIHWNVYPFMQILMILPKSTCWCISSGEPFC